MATRVEIIGVRLDLTMDYGRRVLLGIQRCAQARNWRLLFELCEAPTTPAARWLECGVGGMIVQVQNEADLALSKAGFPLVNVSGVRDDALPTVTTNDRAVGRLAAEHLMAIPLTHFAYFNGVPEYNFGQARGEGFRDALREAGFGCEWITTRSYAEALRWLQGLPKPVGLMAPSDQIAGQLLRACSAANYEVRQRVALVGVDNDSRICEYCQPTITSVDQGAEQVGYEAALLLESLMAGAAPPSAPILRAPLGVIVRESSHLNALDPQLAHALMLIRERAAKLNGVEDLLQHVPLSRRTLERLFRIALGRSPLDEINRVRVEHAQRLLIETDLPVREIARQSGMHDTSRLSTALRKSTGLTPLAFRKRSRGDRERS